MSEILSPYKTPADVDRSVAASIERIKALQPLLEPLMAKAMDLFDDIFPQAPHPSTVENPVVYGVSTMNTCPVERIPMGRELTVVLGAGKWLRVFRHTDSSPDAYPRQRLWVWHPEGEMNRQINVLRTHDPQRIDWPYDIETSDYDATGYHQGFVGGASYYGQEPFIAEADEALDRARVVAKESGFLEA